MIDFDEVFGWEYEMIPPPEYWHTIPPRMLHKLHFLNTPVTIEEYQNPINYIKQVAEVDDFVSFKLGESYYTAYILIGKKHVMIMK